MEFMLLDMFVWDESIVADIFSSPWVQLDTVADAAGTTEFVEDGKLSDHMLLRIFEI